jgi:hypothetical protein
VNAHSGVADSAPPARFPPRLVELVLAWLLVVAGLGLVLFVLAVLVYVLYSGITGRVL